MQSKLNNMLEQREKTIKKPTVPNPSCRTLRKRDIANKVGVS